MKYVGLQNTINSEMSCVHIKVSNVHDNWRDQKGLNECICVEFINEEGIHF